MSPRPAPNRRWRWLVRGAWVALLVALGLSHRLWLPHVARVLVAEAPADSSGRFVVFGGDAFGDRAREIAGELPGVQFVYLKRPPGRLQRLGLFPDGEELVRRELEKSNWPADSLSVVETSASSEADVWLALERFLVASTDQHFDVLCPRYSSRRCRRSLDRNLPALASRLHVIPVADSRFSDDNWWLSRTGCKVIADGFFELAFDLCIGEEADMGPEWQPDDYAAELPAP